MDNSSDQAGKSPSESDVAHEKDVTNVEKSSEIVKDFSLIDKLDNGKPIRKKKSLTLNPEAVRSFLEYRLQMMLSKKKRFSDFLKYLIISDSFLNAARRYPIFCLAIGYVNKDVALEFMDLSVFKMLPIKEDVKFSGAIVLSYEKIDSFLLMLKPNRFLMAFDDSNFSNKGVMKAIGHLEFVHGKVALVLKGDYQPKFSLLLNRLSSRKLEYLNCSPDFLTRSNFALKIGHYFSICPINNAHFHKILSYSPNSLSCVIDNNFINEHAILPSSDLCISLKWMHIICAQHYDSLMAFLDLIKEKCLKFQTISINILIIPTNDDAPLTSNTDEILDQVLVVHRKIWNIVEKCRPLVSNLQISSTTHMGHDPANEFSCDWVERAKTMDYFKDAIHEEAVYSIDPKFGFCLLSSKFDDEFLKLEHKTEVYYIFSK